MISEETYNKIIHLRIFRNRFVLYTKYFFDKLRGRKAFLRWGTTLAKHEQKMPSPSAGKTILFPTAFFLERGLAWQVTIAKALEIRGHRVHFMPMDIRFPRRNSLYFDETGEKFMHAYYSLYVRTLLKSFAFPVTPYSQFGNANEFDRIRAQLEKLGWDDCASFSHKGLPIGKMVINHLIHYFRSGPHQRTAPTLDAYKDFLAMALTLEQIISKALDELKPDVLFTLNGSFIDSGLFVALARKRGIRVITFEAGFMLNTIMLGINEPIIEFPMKKYLPQEYDTYTLTPDQNKQLDEYLHTRSLGKDCIFDYWGNPTFDYAQIRRELGLSENAQPDILFTNLLWDSTTITSDKAFSSQQEWIFSTIRYYSSHPERVLLLRIHPAELVPVSLESTIKMAEVIATEFPSLPNNIIIIPPTSTISSYPLTEMSNLTLVYASTAGLEAATMGKNVIVAGETHYRGMKFTYDVHNPQEYVAMLDGKALNVDKESIRSRSRRYAYFFFFGFMVPFPLVAETSTSTKGDQVRFTFISEKDLLPGAEPGLDFVIDVICAITGYRERLQSLIKAKTSI